MSNHASWFFGQIFIDFWKFRIFEKFLIFEKLSEFLKISKKISRCKIEIIFCKITKTRIRVETLCGNYRIG